ncbi:Oligosaccharide translocation protein rft1 [Coemansia thaxteri]|uniref:Man(5)GlcNAc(2)-PP-dolichol translocation protein RFT1 n=1 Tax=Coemansia thaxteri TaxID=2663907 RepID=A0A9W8BBQ9_9FUNG|nr:Oligosaccharide translocation protein rft1 [Coemansia thaxteri]
MVMARFATPSEMGVFAFVSNYGSIPARIVFFPLEEASRAVFSSMAITAAQAKRDFLAPMSSADARAASHVLNTLGKFHLLFGSILAVFGTLLSPTLVSLIKPNDSAVTHALVAYCIYLPLMGINGFLEAFVHCVATKGQLLRLSFWMSGFTTAYALFAVQMLRGFGLGSAGMVVANMLNMLLRITYCKRFISRWFDQPNLGTGPRLAAMTPHPAVAGTCLLSAAVIMATLVIVDQQTLLCRAASLAVGASMSVVVLASIWRFEQPFVQSARALRSGQFSRAKTE